MKSITLALLAALTAAAFAADTPADIAADYREKAAAALTKVNDTLEKAAVPLIAALVKTGDTAGADLLKEQLKAKLAGEPVDTPQPSAAALFKSYDAARAKALEPAQKSAISRIDAVLASSDGRKLDVVSELGKVRAEVEEGKPQPTVNPALPKEWTYHMNANASVSGTVIFEKNGTLKLDFPNNKDTGTWKKGKDINTYELTVNGETGLMTIAGETAEWNRKVGVRHLKVKADKSTLPPSKP